MGEFLEDELGRLGLNIRRHWVSDTRFNIFASAGGRPRVVINSHIDTVPPWFPPREDDARLSRRPACHAKGVHAAIVHAGDRPADRGTRASAFPCVAPED